MSFGPLRTAEHSAPARAAFVPMGYAPMIGMGPEGLQRHFAPKYDSLANHWRKMDVKDYKKPGHV